MMRYRVTFMERTGADGEPSEIPPDYLAIEVPDGVVLDRTFVERTKPQALHNEEQLEEDDSFLSVGEETWDYDIADDRKDEFLAAAKKSQMVIDCEELESSTEPTS
jgi:hypothetical protein